MHFGNYPLVPKAVESFHLEEEYIDELEKENHLLSAFNEDLLAKNEQLTNKIRDLAHQRHFLSKKNDEASQKKDALKDQLDHLMAEQQEIFTRQHTSNETHAVLKKEMNLLSEEKEKLMILCEKSTEHIGELEEKAHHLFTTSEIHLSEQKKLQEALDLLEETHHELLSHVDDLEARKRREESANKLDGLGRIGASVAFGCGALLGSALVPGLIAGGSVYALYQLSKQYIKGDVEQRMHKYVLAHPGTTKNEALNHIFKKNPQNSVV